MFLCIYYLHNVHVKDDRHRNPNINNREVICNHVTNVEKLCKKLQKLRSVGAVIATINDLTSKAGTCS